MPHALCIDGPNAGERIEIGASKHLAGGYRRIDMYLGPSREMRTFLTQDSRKGQGVESAIVLDALVAGFLPLPKDPRERADKLRHMAYGAMDEQRARMPSAVAVQARQEGETQAVAGLMAKSMEYLLDQMNVTAINIPVDALSAPTPYSWMSPERAAEMEAQRKETLERMMRVAKGLPALDPDLAEGLKDALVAKCDAQWTTEQMAKIVETDRAADKFAEDDRVRAFYAGEQWQKPLAGHDAAPPVVAAEPPKPAAPLPDYIRAKPAKVAPAKPKPVTHPAPARRLT